MPIFGTFKVATIYGDAFFSSLVNTSSSMFVQVIIPYSNNNILYILRNCIFIESGGTLKFAWISTNSCCANYVLIQKGRLDSFGHFEPHSLTCRSAALREQYGSGPFQDLNGPSLRLWKAITDLFGQSQNTNIHQVEHFSHHPSRISTIPNRYELES